MAKTIMVQGTGSHVGKSVLTAALCRVFARAGYKTAPFKAQNMALNSFATPDGGEIGRSTAVQAEAAGVEPTVDMNPVLLKPESERSSQVVVLGRPDGHADSQGYFGRTGKLWPIVTGALDRLRAEYDVVVIEGAGSPAEINLREREIVNMAVALYAQSPVLLIADIDRGGVFASLVGTLELLEPDEASLVRAFVINKFRGDQSILDPGLVMLEERTGIPTAGVLPYYTDIHIPEEDALYLDTPAGYDAGGAMLDIAVVRLPHIANFDDFDPLRREPSVSLRYVTGPAGLEAADLVVIPGTKTTASDLEWLKGTGLSEAIVRLRQDGKPVIGICGGYQMLGEKVLDPEGHESSTLEMSGLGLLPVVTKFSADKSTEQVSGVVAADRGLLAGADGTAVSGYEIHMGQTNVAAGQEAISFNERSRKPASGFDGCLDDDGLTLGTYMHGLFHNDELRQTVLQNLAVRRGLELGPERFANSLDTEFDRLADFVTEHLDMDLLFEIAGVSRTPSLGGRGLG
ncbi:MAG: cobyric acid synthase [Chloroflexi bacterium]|nr:cobyric acid synthase [Chloroflexota bacterium]MBT4073189.1 cobyric acid synthase [Chloroflexota bacterium]MBT4515085.1 cobyric acid synthase [Chloroflexota bacterium]